jgi:SAM-dependent methyltransferase
MISSWLVFWDNPHSIYVNARHKDVHYRQIAKEIAALVSGPEARLLDYGSGEALHADIIAAAAGELLLCDGAPSVRAGLEGLFGTNPKIRVLAPHDVARLPDHSLDVIVLHSVVQYLTAPDADAVFAMFRRLLRPDGLLVVSDVIPPNVGAATDAWALLRFGAGNGFLLAALGGLLRAFFSDYRHLRSRLGLTRYSKAAMLQKLGLAGYSANRVAVNIGHNQSRLAYLRTSARQVPSKKRE